LSYTANLPNLGVIWRLPFQGWSVFAATGKGFTLPNLGIPLRNIQCSNDSPEGTQPDGCPNDPQANVKGIIDLQAIIVKNDEVGFNWRGATGSLSGSYYHSFSQFGQTLIVGPQDFILRRVPVDIKGIELSGELKFSSTLKANALYSRIRGKTEFVAGGPLDKEMGVLDINPDKFGVSGTWNPSAQSSLTLGATTLFSRDINVGQSGEEHTKGYTLFDLGAKYDFGRYGTATLGIENLANKQYILSWSQVVGFRNYWAGRGRVVSISHELKF
jgi:iron complex outermembrane receptor protein